VQRQEEEKRIAEVKEQNTSSEIKRQSGIVEEY
jgi:hypothetical protein